MQPTIEYQEQLSELFEELDEFIYDFESYTSDFEEEESLSEEDFHESPEDEENINEDVEGDDSDEEVYVQSIDDDDEHDGDEDYESRTSNKQQHARPQKPEKNKIVDILRRIMNVVRQACSAEYPGLPSLVEQVDHTISKAIKFAYDDDHYGPYVESHVPSFAHVTEEGEISPLLHDCSKLDSAHQFAGMFAPHMNSFMRMFSEFLEPDAPKPELQIPPSWSRTFRPHPLSTPCARFRDEVPEWRATSDNQNATAVFEARCDVASTGNVSPIDMKLSSKGTLLVSTSMGGWKNRIPYLNYYFTQDAETGANDFPRRRSIKVDLTSNPQDVIVDEPRGLVILGDRERIKSYRCIDSEGKPHKKQNVHTMNSKNYSGPLAMLSNGRLARAGKKGVAIWDLDNLPTHGQDGKDIIGNKINKRDFNTWRDDPEDIEPSSGCESTSTINLDIEDYAGKKPQEMQSDIGVWQEHPCQANIMLCGSNPDSQNFYCHSYDLEIGGKPVVRYLGHGGSVDGFSVSTGDSNVFLTWCGDGHARLFDTRQVLPVVTIAQGSELESLSCATLAHPDGIPFVFMGGHSSESIKVWDIRARASVYELATGNNAVKSMAWDASNNTLYASTECPHIDWEGRHREYRMAKIPRFSAVLEADEEEEFEPQTAQQCWPKRAHHGENYFGHVFDAGEHRLYKFSFKMQPDSDILPYYGSSSLSGSLGGFW